MAYSNHKEEKNTMLTCCVCFEPYIDPCIPKNLECGHVCCKECLKQMLTQSRKGFLNCPECRHKMRVPGAKINNLPTNFPLKNLAEHEQKQLRITPLERKATLRRRVTMLREQKSQVEQRQQPTNDQDNSMAKLRLQIECLEQQLQQQQQSPKLQHQYLQHDLPQEDQTYQQRDSNATPYSTPPSQRPLPMPPTLDKQCMSLPVGSSLTQENAKHNSPPSAASTLPAQARRSPPEVTTSKPGSQKQAKATGQDVPRKQLQPIEQFGSFQQAQGIAVTPNSLLAVCDFQAEMVTVFQRKKGKYQKKFDLKLHSKNPSKPADVAVTAKGKFLVARRTVVELYSPKGKYERVLPGYHEETRGLCTVATANDGRILVGDITHFNIIIYDPNGEAILQTLNTDTKPARIAALQGTLIAISHARLGRLEIFDSSLNQSIRLIDIPEVLGMCYDPYTNSVLAVRNRRLEPGTIQRCTGVVEQYSVTTGVLMACIAEELFHPFNLAFTANGILAVADKWTIKIFQVRGADEPPIYE